jgi:hypothetical protein
MWVMMRAMMWVTGTMAAMTPATTSAKGMARTPVGRGGGTPGGGRGGSGGGSGDGGGGSGGCILQGLLLFIVKIYFCVVFLSCVGGIGEVTPPLTLLSCLRYVGVLLGGDGNCPQKIVVCKYQKLA